MGSPGGAVHVCFSYFLRLYFKFFFSKVQSDV
jgi:hypothetical protein